MCRYRLPQYLLPDFPPLPAPFPAVGTSSLAKENAVTGYSFTDFLAIEPRADHAQRSGHRAPISDEELCAGTGFPNIFYLISHLYRHYFPLVALAAWQKKMR
jgi:hypothetical protein